MENKRSSFFYIKEKYNGRKGIESMTLVTKKKETRPPMTRFEIAEELLEHGLEVYQDDGGEYVVIDVPAKEVRVAGSLDELYNFVLKMRNRRGER